MKDYFFPFDAYEYFIISLGLIEEKQNKEKEKRRKVEALISQRVVIKTIANNCLCRIINQYIKRMKV